MDIITTSDIELATTHQTEIITKEADIVEIQ